MDPTQPVTQTPSPTPAQPIQHDTRTIVIVILLVLVYPIGAILMWPLTRFPLWAKILLSLPLIGLLLTFISLLLSSFDPLSVAR